jgi:uncharacterized phage-like protein YoqJ
MTKIAVTGHRPDKLGGYPNCDWHKAIRRHMRDFLHQEAAANGDIEIISGGALGIDQMWIEVGLFLEIPVIAALPFDGFDSRWPVESQKKLRSFLDRCTSVVYVEETPSREAFQRRNEWMVDNCDKLVAYWNGTSGGTANCLKYAQKITKLTYIINPNKLK